MRATLDASLCTPSSSPITVATDAINADVTLSGKPTVTLPAVDIELPNVTVTLPTIKVELYVTLHPKVGHALEVTMGDVTINAGTLRIRPGQSPGLATGIDLGSAKAAAHVDALKLTASGCLVLNGGAPPSDLLRPAVNRAFFERPIVTILGAGFGATAGRVEVILSDGSKVEPLGYIWTDGEVRVRMPDMPAGVHTAIVFGQSGASSVPASFKV